MCTVVPELYLHLALRGFNESTIYVLYCPIHAFCLSPLISVIGALRAVPDVLEQPFPVCAARGGRGASEMTAVVKETAEAGRR